ncbi:hypothetical protein LO762_11080 [Actinocorallia sp. API 0066]|uniref:hypothetical protein n=1 Tax=Actinocorallia sp. API 0066 TaxID=2896846 RepID=UPI001E4A2084|nr:hypothetical protein [Actinocorallia sp. API 0066]MCD0449728.1 hypothetical protein [Actinocorallia sp. API 0066]
MSDPDKPAVAPPPTEGESKTAFNEDWAATILGLLLLALVLTGVIPTGVVP